MTKFVSRINPHSAALAFAGLLTAFTVSLATPADARVVTSTYGAVQRACDRSPHCELLINCTGKKCNATGVLKGGGTFSCGIDSKSSGCVVIYVKKAPTGKTPPGGSTAGKASSAGGSTATKHKRPVNRVSRHKVKMTGSNNTGNSSRKSNKH